jgi:uncharacterized membrane-anchored protein YitT (DUF2179 family)
MVKKEIIKDYAKRYAITTLGCILYSLGVSVFLDSGGLSSGGVTGIAIMLRHVLVHFGIDYIETGIISMAINIPLLIVGTWYFGKKFLFSTVYSTILSSLLMVFWKYIFADFLPITDNMLINGVFGGAIFAVGAGLIFRMGGSTGGTDIPVKMLRSKFRHVKTGFISMTSDIIVVATSYIVFKLLGEGNSLDKLFYTIVSVCVFTLVFDWVLYGGNSAKLVYIITSEDKVENIRRRVLEDVDTGATLMNAEGAYSRQPKNILMCVVKPFLYPKLRDVVYQNPNDDVI